MHYVLKLPGYDVCIYKIYIVTIHCITKDARNLYLAANGPSSLELTEHHKHNLYVLFIMAHTYILLFWDLIHSSIFTAKDTRHYQWSSYTHMCFCRHSPSCLSNSSSLWIIFLYENKEYQVPTHLSDSKIYTIKTKYT